MWSSKKASFKQNVNPVTNKHGMTIKIIRLELSEQLWLNPNMENYYFAPWAKQYKNGSTFWMIWRCHGIPCFQFYFLLKNNGMREILDKNDFRRCYGSFENVIAKVLDHSYVVCRDLDNGIWKTPYSWRFYWHEST